MEQGTKMNVLGKIFIQEIYWGSYIKEMQS